MNSYEFHSYELFLSHNTVRQRRNNLNCTFEHGLCNWQHETVDSDLKWHLHSGPTNSRETGPPSDHTTQTLEGKILV